MRIAASGYGRVFMPSRLHGLLPRALLDLTLLRWQADRSFRLLLEEHMAVAELLVNGDVPSDCCAVYDSVRTSSGLCRRTSLYCFDERLDGICRLLLMLMLACDGVVVLRSFWRLFRDRGAIPSGYRCGATSYHVVMVLLYCLCTAHVAASVALSSLQRRILCA
jgi:hypothetical protein